MMARYGLFKEPKYYLLHLNVNTRVRITVAIYAEDPSKVYGRIIDPPEYFNKKWSNHKINLQRFANCYKDGIPIYEFTHKPDCLCLSLNERMTLPL